MVDAQDIQQILLEPPKFTFPSTEVSKSIPLSYDLGIMAAMDSNPLNQINEQTLMSCARDAVQSIVNELWKLPMRRSEDGTTVLIALPASTSLLPREKPIPKPKVPTRWEKFAKEKGIHRTKNSKIEWSDEKKDWVPTWGYQGANQDEDWVTEIPENADPMVDHIQAKRDEKKKTNDMELKRQARNQAATFKNEVKKPDATLKSFASSKKSKSAVSFKLPTSADASKEQAQVAAPVTKEQRKHELKSSIKITKGSTASMGKFDRKLANEDAVKLQKPKRKFNALILDKAVEQQNSEKILNRLFSGEGVAKVTGKATNRQVTEDAKEKSGRKRQRK